MPATRWWRRLPARVEHAGLEGGRGAAERPAQRLEDFIQGRASVDLPDCSYPRASCWRVDELLPERCRPAAAPGPALRGQDAGLPHNEAVVVAVESRTLEPGASPRPYTEHVQVKGLYPCGEGGTCGGS